MKLGSLGLDYIYYDRVHSFKCSTINLTKYSFASLNMSHQKNECNDLFFKEKKFIIVYLMSALSIHSMYFV